MCSSSIIWFLSLLLYRQGSGNFEIWIGPADDDINEPISPPPPPKKYVYIICHEN